MRNIFASFCLLAMGFLLNETCLGQTLPTPIDYCNNLAAEAIDHPDPDHLHSLLIDIVNSPSCLFQVSLSNREANNAISPARVSLWNAYQSFSSEQQQGSSLSSSGSTNAVSKPSGPTSLVEEFGGANVTRGTSSSTVQWSPGTMLTNLALNGVNYLCLENKKGKDPSNCISPRLLRDLTPLTFKVTANTTSGTPSLTGTATSTGSTGPSQQVTGNSKGTSGPSFAGLTVQYSLPFASRNVSAVKSLTAHASSGSSNGQNGSASQPALEYYKKEILGAHKMELALGTCTAYQNWKEKTEPLFNAKLGTITKTITNPNDKSQAAQAALALQSDVENQYRTLLNDMTNDASCQSAFYSAKGFYAAILEAETYEYFVATESSSAKPDVAFEYDLQTPQDKPSYSTVKATGTWQFGGKAPTQQNLNDFANIQISRLAKTKASTAVSAKELSQASKPLAQDTTRPFSLTLNGTVDIYNSEPPSSVPSASHLRDIRTGAEFDWVVSPFGKGSVFANFLGSLTAAAAYSYEDQTSPALLTGPALSDFTGLPSSTTAAYAKRGVIHLGQIRFGFGTGKNLTYPLAFTYSNRTELITHPTWGLQFGITYNFTSMFNSGEASNTGSK